MVTITTLIGIGGSWVELAAWLGAGTERAQRMPKNRVTTATLLRMRHGSGVGGAVPSVYRGARRGEHPRKTGVSSPQSLGTDRISITRKSSSSGVRVKVTLALIRASGEKCSSRSLGARAR